VEVSLKEGLKPSSKYKIVIKKIINPNLTEDVVVNYDSAQPLQIKDFTYVSNTEMCVYFTNDLYDWGYPSTPEE